jgi:hypothetical protein
VVMEEAVARLDREQLTNRELADSRTAEQEDDLGSHTPKIRLAGALREC